MASRESSKLMRMAIASMRSWNCLLVNSPAPSSIMLAMKLATPSLASGSWALPPSKAKRMAMSGMSCSSTSQAVMPPGLFTSWIFMASALLETNPSAPMAIAKKMTLAANLAAASAPHLVGGIALMLRAPSGFVGGGGWADAIALGFGGHRVQGPGHGAANIQILAGDALDILGRDLGNRHRPVVDLLDGQAEHQSFPITPRQGRLAIGFVDEIGDEGLLGTFELIGRNWVFAQFMQDAIDARFHFVEPDILGGDSIDANGTAIEAEPRVPATRAGGELFLHHELLIEAAGAAMADNFHEQVESFGVAGLGLWQARRQVEAAHRGVSGTRILQLYAPGGAARRLLRAHTRVRFRVGLDLPIRRLGQFFDLLDGDVARHHHDRIVGGVEAFVERKRIGPRQLGHLVHPTNDGDAIGVVAIERRRHLFRQDVGWVVLGARAALLEDHLAFRDHVLLGKLQVRHAIGFHLHDGAQAFLGYALEITRVVVGREGIVLATEAGDDLGEVTGGNLVRRLEHQMFKKVGNARRPRRIVGRACEIPHIVRDDRGAVVRDDNDAQPVCQCKLADAAGDGTGIEGSQTLSEHHEC